MSQTPAEGRTLPSKRKKSTGGRSATENTRTKRQKTANETQPADVPGMRTRSRSMVAGATEKGRLFKKKPAKAKAKETEVPAQDAGAQPGGDVEVVQDTTTDWLGGPQPVIIKPSADLPDLGDRPDIALLLETATTQGDLDGDPLYQVLTKIRNSPLCTRLLNDVARQAPPDWKTLVAEQKGINEEERAAENDILELLDQVPSTACVVVVDGVGFPGLEADVEAGGAKAGYNSTLHFVHHAQNDDDDMVVPPEKGGNYFTYLHDVVFELCNAAQRENFLTIEAEAADGKLDCVSYCLAKETQELASETRHDELLKSLLKDASFLSVVDEESQDNRQIRLKPPALNKVLYSSVSPSSAKRLENNVQAGHTTQYLKAWKSNYWPKYADVNKDAAAGFEAWTEGTGEAPEIPYKDVVRKLTGIDVSDKEILQIQAFVEETYDNPDSHDPEAAQSSDDDYTPTTTTSKKPAPSKKRKGTSSAKKPVRKKTKTRNTNVS
ncbi:hypothetical protein ACQP2K_19130 [Microbispora siamensis]